MVSEDFTAAQYRIYDQYLEAIKQYDKGAMRRFWEQHRRNIFKKGLYVPGLSFVLFPVLTCRLVAPV